MTLNLPADYTIEEFRIERTLGLGGFGITYLAQDQKLNRTVAIKEFMPESLVSGRDPVSRRPEFRNDNDRQEFQRFLERFREEAQNIAKFNHPNIVLIHRVLGHNDTAYIVMEHVGETSLREIIAARTTVP